MRIFNLRLIVKIQIETHASFLFSKCRHYASLSKVRELEANSKSLARPIFQVSLAANKSQRHFRIAETRAARYVPQMSKALIIRTKLSRALMYWYITCSRSNRSLYQKRARNAQKLCATARKMKRERLTIPVTISFSELRALPR